MAWIKAQNGNLFDVTSIHVQDGHSCEVRGRTQGFVGTFTLGTYRSNAIAEKVKDRIYGWINSTGGGVWRMADKDYLAEQEFGCRTCQSSLVSGAPICASCGTGHTNWKPRAVPDVKLPCKFFGGPLDGTTMCVSNASKNVSIPAVADGGLGSWEYERIGARTDFILKAFPAHDASKPIYGVTDTNLGEKIEFVRGEETLTCKVIKIVRKGTHGIFKTELTKE